VHEIAATTVVILIVFWLFVGAALSWAFEAELSLNWRALLPFGSRKAAPPSQVALAGKQGARGRCDSIGRRMDLPGPIFAVTLNEVTIRTAYLPESGQRRWQAGFDSAQGEIHAAMMYSAALARSPADLRYFIACTGH
jgi:hypothetical protein